MFEYEIEAIKVAFLAIADGFEIVRPNLTIAADRALESKILRIRGALKVMETQCGVKDEVGA